MQYEEDLELHPRKICGFRQEFMGLSMGQRRNPVKRSMERQLLRANVCDHSVILASQVDGRNADSTNAASTFWGIVERQD